VNEAVADRDVVAVEVVGEAVVSKHLTNTPEGLLNPLPIVTGASMLPFGILFTALLRESATYTSPKEVTNKPIGILNPLPMVTGEPMPFRITFTALL